MLGQQRIVRVNLDHEVVQATHSRVHVDSNVHMAGFPGENCRRTDDR
jgi:hypothetical protein